MAKAFLSERGIDFELKDVSVDEQAVFELVRKYKSRSTPTVVVGDQVMIGFDPERLELMLVE
jgi:glutaredoxin